MSRQKSLFSLQARSFPHRRPDAASEMYKTGADFNGSNPSWAHLRMENHEAPHPTSTFPPWEGAKHARGDGGIGTALTARRVWRSVQKKNMVIFPDLT